MALFGEEGVELELGLVLDVIDGFRRGLEAEELQEPDPAFLGAGPTSWGVLRRWRRKDRRRHEADG